MTDVIADREAREQALDPSASYIVQSPAGSGKTELLIQRYLNLLSLVNAPEEIIAITFTRKAAAEMQARILGALDNIGSGEVPDTDHGKKTAELARAALAQDARMDWQLLDNPGRLRIQTIDAFCSLVTRQMPILSRLGAQPEIVDDPEPLYERAALNTLALIDSGTAHAVPVQILLRHLDNDHPRVKGLLVSMLRKRDQWLPHVSADHQREHLQQSLKDLIEEKLLYLDRLLTAELKNELLALLAYAAKNLSEGNPAHPFAELAGIDHFPGTDAGFLDHWQALAGLLLTGQNTWRKAVTVKNGFPPAGKKNDPEAGNREQMKKRLQEVIRRMGEDNDIRNHFIDVRLLPPVMYSDSDWQVVKAVCDVLLLAAAQLQVIFAESNKMDFSGVAQAAISALGDEGSGTDLALQLDYQVKHLLVDEYQDISVTQYILLQRLTAEWSQDDNRSLFLVGDPQQSIYRFREAEVGLFVKTFERGLLGNVALTPLRLEVNFRSGAGVVDWINESFSRVFPVVSDAMNGAVNYSRSVARHEATTERPVTLHCQYHNDSSEEAANVIDIINTIHDRDADATIAILVRSRAHLCNIVPELKKQAIPFSAVEIDALSRKPVIQDLLMITRAYLHPADRIAWLAVLRAPWCGLELEGLHALFNDREQTVFEALQQQDISLQQNPATGTHLQNVYAVFREAFHNRFRKTLCQTVESIWCQLGGPATLASAEEMENVAVYFDLLESQELGGTLEELDDLANAVNSLFAVSQHAGAQLQIMTIHKAKGLEFDHVIVPGLGKRPRAQDTRLLAWWLRPRNDGGEDLILGPIKEAGVSESALYQYLAKVERDKQHFEDARLLYVATTRAIQSLHLLGHAKVREDRQGHRLCEPENGSFLMHLWPVVADEFEKNMPATIEKDENDGLPVASEQKRLSADWQRPVPPESVTFDNGLSRKPVQEGTENVEYEWAGETIRHIGTIVHACLRQIAEDGLDKWDEAGIRARARQITLSLKQAGVADSELADATQQVIQALLNIIMDTRGRWLLGADCREAMNEYRISGILDGRIVNAVIDRTFVDKEGCRWIIDYKTSRHEGPDIRAFLQREDERYRPQLEMYTRLIQAMDNRPVRRALYFPLLKEWQEVLL
ncbi:MAG TPA: UvrD-helicase domain-containing protein [Gammaproteobacteria bacterium]|nr:UvrD-helicase domain-containing protein [Gammaproteobacteria bacterium]